MSFDCTTNTYESLYARWLEKPGELLDWADYRPEQRLLDLCGGTGAVTKAALARGAKTVWLLDLNPRISDKRVITLHGRAEDVRGGKLSLKYNPLECDECVYPPPSRTGRYGTDWVGEDPFDLVVCRQALGYLNLSQVARSVASVTKPLGRFVFNNFVKPKWSFKPYRYQDRWFVEASGYVGRKVFHLQATDGDFDVTMFRWYTPEEIEQAFVEPLWTLVKREVTSRSVRYCYQRGT